jgi:hypothetical protein
MLFYSDFKGLVCQYDEITYKSLQEMIQLLLLNFIIKQCISRIFNKNLFKICLDNHHSY